MALEQAAKNRLVGVKPPAITILENEGYETWEELEQAHFTADRLHRMGITGPSFDALLRLLGAKEQPVAPSLFAKPQVQKMDNTGKIANLTPLETAVEQLGIGNAPLGCSLCGHNITRQARDEEVTVEEIKRCGNCDAVIGKKKKQFCFACGTQTSQAKCHNCGIDLQSTDEEAMIRVLYVRAENPKLRGRAALNHARAVFADDEVFSAEIRAQARNERWLSKYQDSGILPGQQEGGRPVGSNAPFAASIHGEDRAAISIDGSQHKQLCEALLSAFPTYQDLEMMVFDQLGVRLHSITGGGNLQYTAFELIRWATSSGNLDKLVAGAIRQNGRNPQLIAIGATFSPIYTEADVVVCSLKERIDYAAIDDKMRIFMQDFLMKSGYEFSSQVLRNPHNAHYWIKMHPMILAALIRTLPPHMRTRDNLAVLVQVKEELRAFENLSDYDMDMRIRMHPLRYNIDMQLWERWQTSFNAFRRSWEQFIS
jgi:hypothetical protein